MKPHLHPRHAAAPAALAVLADALRRPHVALFLRTLCALRLACASRGVGVA